MKQKESYAKQVAELLNNFSESNSSKKNFQNLCLAEIAVMLGVIADILEGRNIEFKDGKTAQDTMQDDIQ